MQACTARQLRDGTVGPSDASHPHTAQMLQEACSELQVLELEDYEEQLAESGQHLGRSARVSVLACKNGS